MRIYICMYTRLKSTAYIYTAKKRSEEEGSASERRASGWGIFSSAGVIDYGRRVMYEGGGERTRAYIARANYG